MSVSLHYFKDSTNFGDALSPLLVGHIASSEVVWGDPYHADVVGPGSVLYAGHYLYRYGTHARAIRGCVSYVTQKLRTSRVSMKVWGTGFLQYPDLTKGVAPLRKVDVLATRGRYTHQILVEMGACRADQPVAYGDPGLLYPTLLSQSPEKRFDLGFIPHYFDKGQGQAILKQLQEYGLRVQLIDVLNPDPIETIRHIAECDAILSSSLHGCIVADGMGIPNHHLSLSTLEMGREDYLLKFKDYYSALDMELPESYTGSDIGKDILVRLKNDYCVSADKVSEVKDSLLKVFPR